MNSRRFQTQGDLDSDPVKVLLDEIAIAERAGDKYIIDQGAWRLLCSKGAKFSNFGSRPTDLIEFLNRFKHIFDYVRNPGTDNIIVSSCINLTVCETHIASAGSCTGSTCRSLHCCKKILTGNCKFGQNCEFGHDLSSSHNAILLDKYQLDASAEVAKTPWKLGVLLKVCNKKQILGGGARPTVLQNPHIENRQERDNGARPKERHFSNRSRLLDGSVFEYFPDGPPKECRRYNGKVGCNNERCKDLHICWHYLKGDCHFGDRKCNRSHDLFSGQPERVLRSLGIDVDNGNHPEIFKELREHLSKSSLSSTMDTSSKADNNSNYDKRCVPRNSHIEAEWERDNGARPKEHHCSNRSGFRGLAFEYFPDGPPKECRRYNSKEGCNNGRCKDLHICWHYLKGDCRFGDRKCNRSHDLFSGQPERVLRSLGVDVDNGDHPEIFKELREHLSKSSPSSTMDTSSKVDNSSDDDISPNPAQTSLSYCFDYNAIAGDRCRYGDQCNRLHLCRYYLEGKCKAGDKCKRSHDVFSPLSISILARCGVNLSNPDLVLQQIRSHIKEKPEKKMQKKKMEKRPSSPEPTVSTSSTVPVLECCSHYNRGPSGDSCKHGEKCYRLHLCRYYLQDLCKAGVNCKRCHDVFSSQSRTVLLKCGVDVHKGKEQVLEEIRSRIPMHKRRESSPESNKVNDDQCIDEICTFDLRGKCQFGTKCRRHHPHLKHPYLWQRMTETGEWLEFADSCQTDIETSYCNPMAEDCSTTDHSERYKINFKAPMKYSMKRKGTGSVEETNDVRRLGTRSSSSTTYEYLTLWCWFWQDDNKQWIEYGQNEDGAKEHGGLSSRDLEEEFSSNPACVLSFEHGGFKYNLDMSTMTQKNTATRNVREVRRRPAMFDPQTKKPTVQRSASFDTLSDSVTPELAVSKFGPDDFAKRLNLFNRPDNVVVSPKGIASSVAQRTTFSIKYPLCWNMDAKSVNLDYQIVEITATGLTAVEYADIAKLFAATMPTTLLKSIKRIQNFELWENFIRKEQSMKKKQLGRSTSTAGAVALGGALAGTSIATERLFHGTAKRVMLAICEQGFDWRLNGTSTGTLYGKGSYFAKEAQYSSAYTDCNTMFVVKVLVGSYTKGEPSFVRPPPRDPTNLVDCYDSCVDDPSNPKIFVIFAQQQAYPEYLIEYY